MLFSIKNNFNKISLGIILDTIMPFYSNISYKQIASCGFVLNCLDIDSEYKYMIKDGYLSIINSELQMLFIPFNMDGEQMPYDELAVFMKTYKLRKVICIPSGVLDKSCKEYFKVVRYNRVGYEYIYDNYMLSALEGGEFKNLRNKVHKFRNKYLKSGNEIIEFKNYDRIYYKDAINAYNLWYSENVDKLKKEKREIWDREYYRQCLIHCFDYDIKFILVFDKVKSECVGAMAYKIYNSEIAHGIFRKLSNKYDYISQYMQYYQSLELMNKGVLYTNDSNDGGYIGLRNLKMGFHPVDVMQFKSIVVKD